MKKDLTGVRAVWPVDARSHGTAGLELEVMSDADRLKAFGTQVFENSHIALTKHKTVRDVVQDAIVGFA